MVYAGRFGLCKVIPQGGSEISQGFYIYYIGQGAKNIINSWGSFRKGLRIQVSLNTVFTLKLTDRPRVLFRY